MLGDWKLRNENTTSFISIRDGNRIFDGRNTYMNYSKAAIIQVEVEGTIKLDQICAKALIVFVE